MERSLWGVYARGASGGGCGAEGAKTHRSRLMSGVGMTPIAAPIAFATDADTFATSGYGVLICSNTYSTISRYVYSSGPVEAEAEAEQPFMERAATEGANRVKVA